MSRFLCDATILSYVVISSFAACLCRSAKSSTSHSVLLVNMPVNIAVRAVVRSPGKAAPLGVLCLRVGAFTFLCTPHSVLQYHHSNAMFRDPRQALHPEHFK